MSSFTHFALCFLIGFAGSAAISNFTDGMSHTSTVLVAMIGGYVICGICSAIRQGVRVSK